LASVYNARTCSIKIIGARIDHSSHVESAAQWSETIVAATVCVDGESFGCEGNVEPITLAIQASVVTCCRSFRCKTPNLWGGQGCYPMSIGIVES